MTSAALLAWTSPISPEAENDFHTWYDQTHIPQVRKAIPSIGQVQRYRLLDENVVRYLCWYELTDGDAAGAAAALGAAAASGALDQSDAVDTVNNPPLLQFVVPVG